MSFETDPSIHKRLEAWIKEKNVSEIELILPDMNGIIRGKVVPAPRFLKGVSNHTLRIASSILNVTVTGEYPDHEGDDSDGYSGTLDPDCVLVPILALFVSRRAIARRQPMLSPMPTPMTAS